MNDASVVSVAQLRELIKFTNRVEFRSSSKEEMYRWVEEALGKFHYFSLRSKKEKTIVLSYLKQMTGLSRGHIKKLVKRKKRNGKILRITSTRHFFPRIYGSEDIARLIETDNAHGRMSGEATKRILERQYAVYGDRRFERIRHISVSHLYNLRGSRQYESHIFYIEKTRATSVPIGIRRKPEPHGKPGYIRVDSVHQGDWDKEKGVYHINLVDEVTQWEVVGCVEGISEQFLEPLLEALLDLFPFRILNFHSDNGSEYINYVVAKLLSKLTIEQTKSRARRTNDNALVEGKNGAVIRKYMGYAYIPGKYASLINHFYREHMDDYLNFHRPCGFATSYIDRRGREKKKYDTYLTPFEKLKLVSDVETYLKPDATLAMLEAIARKESDNVCAEWLQDAKRTLLETIHQC
ncbi:MAG: DDE-type integrase/transposase/recombinase [Candidatus Sungbacteria bacterium]|nr:DDE-type integrase/transposase/recombinase [Candidatus Sungbacteria bacterium]